MEYFQGKLYILSLFAIRFGKMLKSWSCNEADVDMNVGCDGSKFGRLAFMVPRSETEGRVMRQCGLSNEAENSFWLFL